MLEKLVKIANRLDQLGETKLADEVDALVRKIASEEPHVGMKGHIKLADGTKVPAHLEIYRHTVQMGDTLADLTEENTGKFEPHITTEHNAKLNHLPAPYDLHKGQTLSLWYPITGV